MRGLLLNVRRMVNRHPVLYRLRFALILRLDEFDFIAAPDACDQLPDLDAPPEFRRWIEQKVPGVTSRFADVCRLAHQLSHGHPRGPGLGVDSVRALAAIEAGGAGVCSDYTQLFLGLCRTAGIPCREWGLTSSLTQRGVGHALVEVYPSDLEQWIMIDPYLSVYATRQDDGQPLGMTELVQFAEGGKPRKVEIRVIDQDATSSERRAGFLERYFQPGHFFFVLSNNDVFRHDVYQRRLAVLPMPARHLIMVWLGVYQRFHLYTVPQRRSDMESAIRRLQETRQALIFFSLLAAAGLVAIAAALLAGSH